MRCYTRAELSSMLGIDIHLFKALQETGLLEGVKTGKGYRYDEEVVDQFLRRVRGHDISNPYQIWNTARLTKNGADPARHHAIDGSGKPSSLYHAEHGGQYENT